MARSVRLRLEDEARAGLTAAVRAKALVSEAGSPAASSFAAGASADEPAAIDGSPAASPAGSGEVADAGDATAVSAAPEARAAAALKQDLSQQVHVAATTDLFDFGSPDLEAGLSRQEALERIAVEVAACDRCRELAASRTRTVPGQGDPNAKLVFIGEGPGEEEDRQGLAFVGRAGELLTKMIEAIGLVREQVFICNIIKCRPPGNRVPMPDEEANCTPYLARQLEIIRPKVICALGGTAAKWLLQTHDGITRLRGRFYPYRGVQLMPTFHPAYVLRNYTPDTRKKVYDDLLKVRAAMDQ
jgi:DNA polymerase